MPKIITDNIFDRELTLISPKLTRVGTYWGSKVKLEVACVACNHRWQALPSNLLHKTKPTNCPNCNSKKRSLSNDDVDIRLKSRPIQRITNYSGTNTKIEWKCLQDHNHDNWLATPDSILNSKQGCPSCGGTKKHTIEYINDILKKLQTNIIIDPNYPFINMNTKTSFRCNNNSTHPNWYATPSSIINSGCGCPTCSNETRAGYGNVVVVDCIKFRSLFESRCYVLIKRLCESLSYELHMQVRYPDGSKKTCDFYIPKINTWIEVSQFKHEMYLQRINEKNL